MKRPAWRFLSGCLLAALAACTGAATPPSHSTPSHSTPASVAAGSAATGATPVPPVAMPSVVAVVTGYYRTIVIRNYRRAFGYLAPGATGPDGSKLTLRSFLQLAQMLDGMGGPVTRFSIGVSPSEVVMTLSRARYGPYHAHLRMVRTGHGWAIDFIDRI
jgi:hypothetical protein